METRLEIEKMTLKIFFLLACFTFLNTVFSCETRKNKKDNLILNFNESNIIVENDYHLAMINSDVEYYISFSGEPHGVLSKGEKVLVLDYSVSEKKDDSSRNVYFDVSVGIKTINGEIIGYVKDEKCLTYYYNTNNDLWCKDILLTREYYYQGSIDYIYDSGYSFLLNEGLNREDSLLFMRSFFSEHRFLISDRYLVMGNLNYSIIYKILSLVKENDNTYSIIVTNQFKDIYKLIISVDDNSIMIKDMKKTKEGQHSIELIEGSVGIRYIPRNINKSKILKDNLDIWIQNKLNK